MSFFLKHLALFLCLAYLSSNTLWAQNNDPIIIIVHPQNSIPNLSQSMILKIYEGKKRFWNPGNLIFLCDLKRQENIRLQFSQEYLDKTPNQMAQLYLRMAITGKGSSPQTLPSVEKMIETVSQNPSAIGYIPLSALTSKVRRLRLL